MKINLTATTELTATESAAARKLEQRVQVHDHTFNNIYMSNQFNAESTMNAFFLASTEDELVGFLMIYADEGPEEAAELHVIVDPEFRRRGIATQLIAAAKQELTRFGYHKVEYVTERRFLTANPTFLQQVAMQEEEGTEFQLSCARDTNADYVLPAQYQLRHMRMADIPTVAAQKAAVFEDTDLTTATRYLEASAIDSSICQYVLTDATGTLLGGSSIDLGTAYYFFGLYVDTPYQGRGLGTTLVQAMMADLARSGDQRRMQLGVESDNPIARHVYEKAGFTVETEVVYIEPQN